MTDKEINDLYQAHIADMVRHVIAIERERLTAAWEALHGFDKHGVAKWIKEQS